MKLNELRPKYVRHSLVARSLDAHVADGLVLGAITTEHVVEEVKTFEECNGISYLCPGCLAEGKSHTRYYWSFEKGASYFAIPTRFRWKFYGTNFDDMTIMPDYMNEQSTEVSECDWTGFIMHGKVN